MRAMSDKNIATALFASELWTNTLLSSTSPLHPLLLQARETLLCDRMPVRLRREGSDRLGQQAALLARAPDSCCYSLSLLVGDRALPLSARCCPALVTQRKLPRCRQCRPQATTRSSLPRCYGGPRANGCERPPQVISKARTSPSRMSKAEVALLSEAADCESTDTESLAELHRGRREAGRPKLDVLHWEQRASVLCCNGPGCPNSLSASLTFVSPGRRARTAHGSHSHTYFVLSIC